MPMRDRFLDRAVILGAALTAAVALGCPPEEVDLVVSATAAAGYDECAEICVQVSAMVGLAPAEGGGLRIGVDGGELRPAGELGTGGSGEACAMPQLPGSHTLLVEVIVQGAIGVAEVPVTVHPFGYDWGLTKSADLEGDPPRPVLSVHPGNPVFEPELDAWDGNTVMMPSVAATDGSYWLLYAGKGTEYRIGAASSPDGLVWTREAAAPVIPAGIAGPWTTLSVGGPSLLVEPAGGLRAWFQARGDGPMSIGLAASDDGVEWTAESLDPVFEPGVEGEWDGAAVGHPAVGWREGVYELWYSSSEQQVGYAISADGLAWTRYCHNPVFLAQGTKSWEAGATKSPEVLLLDGTYHLFFTAGGAGQWQVGHAASADGLRWSRSGEDPLLPAGAPGSWNEAGTSNANPVQEQDGSVTIWYTGISTGPSALGLATVESWD